MPDLHDLKKHGDVVEVIEIDSYTLLKIERYWYELSGLKEVLVQFTSDSPFKPDMERYELILNQYMEAFMTYNIAYNVMFHEYAPEYAGNSEYKDLVDFHSGTLIISKNTGGSCSTGSCNCSL